eukprot:10386719-Alexandrium_andersonii.AAC.1
MDSGNKGVVRDRLGSHEAYRMAFGGKGHLVVFERDLSWCGTLNPSAQTFCRLVEDIVYNATFDWVLKLCQKANKGIDDTLEHDTLKEQLDTVTELIGEETGKDSTAPSAIVSLDEEFA